MYEITPVGQISSSRQDPQETDHWGAVISTITIDDRFPDDCLQGLEHFSHIEIVFLLDRFEARQTFPAGPPRGRGDLPAVGVFADRGPRRPNRLGVTICTILAIRGRQFRVGGLDAVDGTPVIDIKPVMRQHLPDPDKLQQPAWVDKLLKDYYPAAKG
jgi:tRNA-Thr(GGU) m(6)t(6)A37 methyltransferase TsaA